MDEIKRQITPQLCDAEEQEGMMMVTNIGMAPPLKVQLPQKTIQVIENG